MDCSPHLQGDKVRRAEEHLREEVVQLEDVHADAAGDVGCGAVEYGGVAGGDNHPVEAVYHRPPAAAKMWERWVAMLPCWDDLAGVHFDHLDMLFPHRLALLLVGPVHCIVPF